MTEKASVNEQILLIEGAGCASCVGKIEKALNHVAGVEQAAMNFAQRSVTVTGDVAAQHLVDAVEAAGYRAKLVEQSESELFAEKEKADQLYYRRLMKNMAIALALGVPMMLYGMVIGDMSIDTTPKRVGWFIAGLLTLAVMYTAGRHFYLSAWNTLRHHNANMDTLVALGTGTAWLYSMVVVLMPDLFPAQARHVYFEASAMIIGLINLGLALEVRARGRTSEAIKRLIGLQAKTARIVKGDDEIDIPVEHVQVGMLVRVRPGEKIPVDGVVVEGKSTLDESMLTGEPMPVAKTLSDELYTGTLNKSGTLVFKASRVGKDTALAQIIGLVKKAQNAKPSIGRLADTISGYFVPTIMMIAVLSALAWLNFGPEPSVAFAVVSATTVLIIACPCALGLATPMSVMVGVGKAAEAGVLIRNGEALQTSSKLTTIVLDKTGTLTQGQPRITGIYPVDDLAKSEVLRLAASLEAGSEHPLADAVVASAKDAGLSLSNVSDFHAVLGQGVSGVVEGHRLLLGNKRLMAENQVETEALQREADDLAAQAQTPVFFAIDGNLVAVFAIADPLKSDTLAALERLRRDGLKIVMLTGDNTATAAAIAEKLSISEFYAEVQPSDKSQYVQQLQAQGERVGMVGDGINDAPALAQADVGFAIGTGTDIAMESADVTLMRGSLHGLADAIEVSRATLGNIKQNLVGAFIYNVAGIPIAAGVLYPIAGILLSPVVAGAAMAFSSLTVVSNANRLRFFKPSNR